MNDNPQTWHYGLVARYWAEYLTAGSEIAFFQHLIQHYGQPALDAGCGSGRLLIPFLRAGLDVDGCDISPDMLAQCRAGAEREGLRPHLYQQALHELDLPRTYQSIVACGSFGLAVSRALDAVALARLYQHLNPGGLLLLDHHLPYKEEAEWRLWRKEARAALPEPWPETLGKTPPADGSEYEIHSRFVAFDPIEQQLTREMRTLLWDEGQLVTQETYTLVANLYFYHEMVAMLEEAGFKIEAVQAAYTGEPATAEHDVLVFIARKGH